MNIIYYPVYDIEQKKFIDSIPSLEDFRGGIKCNCGCLKKSYFKDEKTFENHLNTPTHKKWLQYFQNLPLLLPILEEKNKDPMNKICINEESNQSIIDKQESAIALLQYEINTLKEELKKQCLFCWLTPN